MEGSTSSWLGTQWQPDCCICHVAVSTWGSINIWLPLSTPISLSNIVCSHANNVVYNTICDILWKEEVDSDDEVMYHAASIQLMQAYLWKNSAQHVLYLLGGLSVIPARFCANSEIYVGTNAYKKVKGLLPLASLNKYLHDLAKEQK